MRILQSGLDGAQIRSDDSCRWVLCGCIRGTIREPSMHGVKLLTVIHSPDSSSGPDIKYIVRIHNGCQI
jgi:hypothetical protein